MRTGQAGLAISRNMHHLLTLYPHGCGGADHLADHAANTVACRLDKMLSGICGYLAGAVQKLLMGDPVGICHRGNPALPRRTLPQMLL